MAEKKFAVITCDVKPDEDGGDRVLVFDGSTEDIDRMDEVIMAEGWDIKNYKKNPVFLWAHNYSMPPIGKSLRTWLDKDVNRLKFKIEFADAETYPFADTIYKLYKGGFMKAVSVGFIPLEVEDLTDEDDKGKKGSKKTPRRRYLRQELLELSAAPVPANPEALQNAVAAGIIKNGEMKAFDSRTAFEPDAKTTYNCECIDCGHKLKSDKHCKDIKCPKCGGEMRREERPADGRDLADMIDIATADLRHAAEELTGHATGGPITVTVPDVPIEEEKALGIGEVLKPYPKEHACRLKDPAQYDECKRGERTAEEPASVKGKKYSIIFCKKKGGKMEEQAYRYDKEEWTAAQAKAHCAHHEGTFEAAQDAMHTEEVEGLWGKTKKVSQAGLMDELEYAIGLLEEVGISKGEVFDLCWEVVRTIVRLTGGDIPDDIAEIIKAKLTNEPQDLVIERDAINVIIETARESVMEEFKNLNKGG